MNVFISSYKHFKIKHEQVSIAGDNAFIIGNKLLLEINVCKTLYLVPDQYSKICITQLAVHVVTIAFQRLTVYISRPSRYALCTPTDVGPCKRWGMFSRCMHLGHRDKAIQSNYAHLKTALFSGEEMSCLKWDLNPQHPVYCADALPTESLRQPIWAGLIFKVHTKASTELAEKEHLINSPSTRVAL